MESKTIIGFGVVCIVLAAAGAALVVAWGREGPAKPAPPASYAGAEVETLMKKKKYDAAVPLLQAKFEEHRGNEKAQAQIKFLLGICAKNIEEAAATRAAAAATQWAAATATRPADAVIDSSIDPSTGEKRVPHEAPQPGVVRELTIKQLGNFDYDARRGGTVPPDVLALDGARVKLKGFMLPLNKAQYITDFALVPSLLNCCFGAPPEVHHVVTVRIPAGKKVEFTMYEVAVEGTLKVEVKRRDEATDSVFELDAVSVKTVPYGKKAE